MKQNGVHDQKEEVQELDSETFTKTMRLPIHIYSDIILSDNSNHYFIQTISYVGRQHSSCHYSNLP
jgi:hypothetical protein